MEGGVEIVVRDTPERFQGMAEEVVRPLLELLRRRNELEREICARYFQLRKEKISAGAPPYLSIPGEREITEEFFRRYLELVEPHCMETLLKWGPARSFGKPARYDCLFEGPESRVYFTMKSTKRAVVETIARKSTDTRYRFILRPSGDSWKVGGVYYTFGNGTDWHVDHSL